MKKVIVGLSGGVDSAVSAALLKERGYEVAGAFIKIWQPEFIECTWRTDRLDAMRVCAALQIPYLEVDLSREYQDEVVKEMLADYSSGKTPNPDVLCNRSIKFGHFMQWARGQGADMVATGHYAQIRKQGSSYELLRGLDTNKDQSYFLHLLGQEDLQHALFPVGNYSKPQVRALAEKFGLPIAKKSDSQGLCFVGDVSMKDFLGRFLHLSPGEVVDMDGAVVGTHDGAALYTIGERHGFNTSENTPMYITHIDIARNILYVSPNKQDAMRSALTLERIHWIGAKPAFPAATTAQARYREVPFPVTLTHTKDNTVHALLDEPSIASPGQSLVFYDGEVCLGGAVINRY